MGDGPPIRLQRTMRRGIMRAFGQAGELRLHSDEGGRERQLASKLVQLLKIEVDSLRALRPQCGLQELGGYVRIAIAISADPAAHPEEGRQRDRGLPWLELRELILEAGVKERKLTQKRIVVVAEAVIDLVDDG